MLEVDPDAVVFASEDSDLKEFLQYAGMPEEAIAALDAKQLGEMRAALADIAASDNNTAGGGSLSAFAGRNHFRLRRTIVVGLIASLGLIASVASAHPLAMAAAGASAVYTMRSLVTRLNDVELDVCVAIKEIMRERAETHHDRTGATEAEVGTRMGPNAPPNLHDVLVKLGGGNPSVLTIDVSAGETCYSLT